MPSRQHKSISPNRPLTVEIPNVSDACMAASGSAGCRRPPGSKEAATEADIKFGERTAFIPMTCQERQVLDRLESGLQAAAALWRESTQQQEHERLLSSALHHWRAPPVATSCGGSIDTSWVWEVGRWSSQFGLPFALELRRLDPEAMADSDQLVALSTCLRNRQIDFAKRLAAAASAATAGAATSGSGSGGKKKPPSQPSMDELEDEPCLCQIRWGLAPDTDAAKRRQLEKLDEDEVSRLQHQPHQQQQQQQQSQPQPPPPPPPPPLLPPQTHQRQSHRRQTLHVQPTRSLSSGIGGSGGSGGSGGGGGVSGGVHMRPIVKTSHLRDLHHQIHASASGAAADDAGYASQNCSPPGGNRGGGGFINDLLAVSTFGGRSWAD